MKAKGNTKNEDFLSLTSRSGGLDAHVSYEDVASLWIKEILPESLKPSTYSIWPCSILDLIPSMLHGMQARQGTLAISNAFR